MRRVRALAVALLIAGASPVSAATIHGLVFDDTNRDGKPSAGEPGVANAVVALGVEHFTVTDASGQFDLEVPDDAAGIVWVRVPDGFTPGPVWAAWAGSGEVDLALRKLPAPVRGPLTFVVASDTHIGITEPNLGAEDLARAVRLATSLEPAPAFFTILGDVTQGSLPEQYAVADKGLADLDVPYIPVAGNHDWYDGGAAWFAHYGPDNYSFDLGGVHFVVWNMALAPEQLGAYLGAELERVATTMPIVALTHDPPREPQLAVLRSLGVDYVLTGHTHSNRVVDHGGIIELNTEPFLMGGIDFTPAGFRVVTIDSGTLSSYHRTVIDEPVLSLVAPRSGDCTPADGGELMVAAELGAGSMVVTARLDCATPFELRRAGDWLWRGTLPTLADGDHLLEIEARAQAGARASLLNVLTVCAPATPVASGADWPQLGGAASHTGSVAHEIVPPLESRWVTALGNHVLTSPPVIAGGAVFVTTTDLGDGNTGGIAAIELATGAVRWRVVTPTPIRGGVAVVGDTAITTQIDGEVLALDAATGAVHWRHAMSAGIAPQAGAVFSPPTVADTTVFVGHQRAIAALDVATGDVRWSDDPVPAGFNSQSAAAIAVGNGLAVGMFHRELGGVIAWDAATGELRWRYEGPDTVALNATPVIGADAIYIVNGSTDVTALDFTGERRWSTRIDAQGFDWGYASVGTPALAGDTLIVPTLYGSLVALDTQTGAERWRYRARPGPLRGTHYRGKDIAAFVASPVITGELVWVADASGMLSALDARTGLVRWFTELPSPVMAGLAASGDWLVIASYDGTVRAMAPGSARPWVPPSPDLCAPPPPPPAPAGCCDAGTAADSTGVAALVLALVLFRRRRGTAAQREKQGAR